MRTSKLWRLLRRGKQRYTGDWWHDFQRRNGYEPGWQETRWKRIASDKYLHRAIRSRVFTGHETAIVTQQIYQGQTMLAWDDDKRTWTMPTTRIKV